MIETNKTYGFTIAIKELKETVPNVFRYASAYRRVNNLTSQGLWEMFTIQTEEDQDDALRDESKGKKTPPQKRLNDFTALPEIDEKSIHGDFYNRCHFWSNFEIANLDWFRSHEYREFFETMDRSGGFWRERVRTSYLFHASLLPGHDLTVTIPVG